MQFTRIAVSPVLTTRPHPGRRARRTLIVLEGVMALNAFGGAWYAIAGAPNVPTEWLAGTPFGDYVLPGVILGAAAGGSQLAAAVALRLGHRRAHELSLAAALVLLEWIVTQLAMIGHVSLSVAFNEMFLVYLALASASFFAFVALWSSIDLARTMVTDALDLATITPSALLAGMLLRRREPLGYLIAIVLLVLLVILAPAIIAQTVSREFTAGEIVGPMVGFVVLGVFAAWCLRGLLRPLEAHGEGRG